jgi:hypothetical protein
VQDPAGWRLKWQEPQVVIVVRASQHPEVFTNAPPLETDSYHVSFFDFDTLSI